MSTVSWNCHSTNSGARWLPEGNGTSTTHSSESASLPTTTTQLHTFIGLSIRRRKLNRMSNCTDDINETKESKSPCPALLGTDHRLVRYEDTPAWYQGNEYAQDHYRSVTGSTRKCLQNLTYIHSETANIYSHLIPAICALFAMLLGDHDFRTKYPEGVPADRLVFAF